MEYEVQEIDCSDCGGRGLCWICDGEGETDQFCDGVHIVFAMCVECDGKGACTSCGGRGRFLSKRAKLVLGVERGTAAERS